jgi:hypothetical protein
VKEPRQMPAAQADRLGKVVQTWPVPDVDAHAIKSLENAAVPPAGGKSALCITRTLVREFGSTNNLA